MNLPTGGMHTQILELLPIYEKTKNLRISLVVKYTEYRPLSNKVDICTIYKFKNSKLNTVYFFLKSFYEIIKINKRNPISIININSYYFNILSPLLIRLLFKIPLFIKPPTNFETHKEEEFMLKPRSLLNKIAFYGWMVILQHFISKRKRIYFQAINNKIYRDFYTMGFDKENFIRLPNGISTNKFEGIKRLHKGEVHFGFIGRLLKSKNLELLLRVFLNYISEYPEDKLFIYGTGPEEIFLRDFIHENKVGNNIFYMGFEKDKEKIYSNLDVLIHPSFGEGFPNVILEALCAQAFIIASDVTGNRDIVHHGVTGLLFNPKDDEDLLKQLIFYKENPRRIPEMLQNAKIDVAKKYDIEKIAGKLLNFLQRRINAELCEN